MPATINNNALELVGDNLGYQAARVELPPQPTDADAIIFYYKAYVDKIPVGPYSETSSNSWDKNAFFGLSFDGTINGVNTGLVGYSNIDNINRASYSGSRQLNPTWNPNDIISPYSFDGGIWRFRYGNPSFIAGGFNVGVVCPNTGPTGADLATAEKYLHIIRINKDVNDAQRISLSIGFNWENLSVNDFSKALTSTSTIWALSDYTVNETTNFRTNWNNPSLSGTINFPSWIVSKWTTPTVDRKFVVTNIKIEYYRQEELIVQIP
jgi:hypothetical protein